MLRIFIGYDPNEVAAYHVLAHSIIRQSSEPVCITPLKLDQLPLTRPRDPKQSTEFAFYRNETEFNMRRSFLLFGECW